MIIFFAAAVALSQVSVEPEHAADASCEDYHDGSTIAIAECLKAQADVWEQRLNAEYQSALSRGEIDKKALENAQRAWLEFRSANCGAYYTVNGSIRTILAGQCWLDMTRARTLELKEMSWTG
jgi:uncharacterized protein YecT (DUF1311 family)